MKIVFEFDTMDDVDNIINTLSSKVASDVAMELERKKSQKRYPDYNRICNPYRKYTNPNNVPKSDTVDIHGYKDVRFDTYSKAAEIRDDLEIRLEEYGQISIADFYEMLDKNYCYSHTLWGWTENTVNDYLGTKYFDISKDDEGWYIVFPDAVLLHRY